MVERGIGGADDPAGPFVRTVLGDIPPGALGICNAHDHLFLRSSLLPNEELDDYDAAVAAATAFASAGGRAVVQWTPVGMGRRSGHLVRLAREAGVHVLAATGIHQLRHYAAPDGGPPRWPVGMDAAALAQLWIAELSVGFTDGRGQIGTDDSPAPAASRAPRAGFVKVATGYRGTDVHEQRALEAAAMAHEVTGAPICVHLELGTFAPNALATLERYGVPPGRVVLGHVGRHPDAAEHTDLAARGAFLAYDGPSRTYHGTDWCLPDVITRLVERGHQHQVLLGGDTTTASARTAPGMARLLTDTASGLARRVGDAIVQDILVTNPARAFAWTPRIRGGADPPLRESALGAGHLAQDES